MGKSDSRRLESSPGKGNRLKRDTPFICNVRFCASLPEVPCDPKMLVAVLQPEKLAAFNITTLEQDMRQDLIVEPDLGIPISLLDTERYAVPDHRPPLAPEDAVLLAGLSTAGTESMTGSTPGKARERLRGEGTELSWLMRTTYIAPDMGGERKQQQPVAAREDAVLGVADRDAQIAEIEASFEHAKAPPVHQRDPSLTVAEMLPVLPDLDRWKDNHVLMVFDGEPTADVARIASLQPEDIQRIAEHAVMKSYTLRGEQNKEDKFIAYMLPTESPERGAGAASTSKVGGEGEYEWVREYNYKVNAREDGGRRFWFCFQVGHVTYGDLGTMLSLMKRSKLATAQSFPRPSKVSVRRRPWNDAEDEMARKRLRDLTGSDADMAALAAQQQLGAAAAQEAADDPGEVDVVGNGWAAPEPGGQPAGAGA